MTLLKRYALYLIWLWLTLLLGACAQNAPLPSQAPRLALPIQMHVQRQSGEQTQDWLLVIQQDGDALRWSLLDLLGVPLARQLLLDGRWQADGLLPPNAEARELFAALLFALSPADQLEELYAGKSWTLQDDSRSLTADDCVWQVRYQEKLRFELDVGPELTYRVAPIAPAGARHK